MVEQSNLIKATFDIPLFGRTHVENEEAVVALYTLRRLLTQRPDVQAWQASMKPGMIEELETTGKIEWGCLMDGAKDICRQLGLPSILIAWELYKDTAMRALSEEYGFRFEEQGWATPSNEDEIRQMTERVLVEGLRFSADQIEGGGLSDVPWPDYSGVIQASIALVTQGAIAAGRECRKPQRGRRHHLGETKAEALFLMIVGDGRGKRSLKQLAAERQRLGLRKRFGRGVPDLDGAQRTLCEWRDQLKRLLLLEPPSI